MLAYVAAAFVTRAAAAAALPCTAALVWVIGWSVLMMMMMVVELVVAWCLWSDAVGGRGDGCERLYGARVRVGRRHAVVEERV